MLEIVIGNKRYSSWSMRPWVVLQATGVPFVERVIPLDQPDTATRIAAVSEAGRVPVLIDGALTVWDSLAICEYLAEKFPDAALWPTDPAARAIARSACAEMHSGFQALRSELSCRIYPPSMPNPHREPGDASRADIARIVALWSELRRRFGQGGPFLFGRFSIADAFFSPVAIGRFRAYGVTLPPEAEAYVSALEGHPAVAAWIAGAHAETLRAPLHE